VHVEEYQRSRWRFRSSSASSGAVREWLRVYLAQDLKHDRAVALKVLHPEIAAGLGAERFLREIRLTARLKHPHILPVFDSGAVAGRPWYTMPYVRGESLRDRLRREIQLPVETAVEIPGRSRSRWIMPTERGRCTGTSSPRTRS
jgi:serine/threonine protein kinase